MAEVQKTTAAAGETTQRFIEFVMMHAQNAALFLGQIPNPQTGQGEVNLELAQMFIDQLLMIREKTRGNLNTDETNVLNNTISNLQMVFFEASQAGGPSSPAAAAPAPPEGEFSSPSPAPDSSGAGAETAEPSEPPPLAKTPPGGEGESRKKFSKSYGS